jgi:hypothetical protein
VRRVDGPKAASAAPRRMRREPGLPLDTLASETLRLFMRTFTRWGYSPTALMRGIRTEAAQLPPVRRGPPRASWIEVEDWTRIGTVWSNDPDYVNELGTPLLLKLRGAAPSLESLINRAELKLTVEEARQRLLSVGAARMVGRRLAAATAHPVFVYAAGSREQSAHHLSVLNALLWNFEYNANPAPGEAPWFERRATAPQFPAAALSTYNLDLAKRATVFLDQEDALMERLGNSMRSRDRKLRAHIHMFMSAPGHRFEPGAREGTEPGRGAPKLTSSKPTAADRAARHPLTPVSRRKPR